jgi:hypothetical protein
LPPFTAQGTIALAVVSIDENSNSQVIVENCAPYEVTIERNNHTGLVEIEDDELIPLTDNTDAKICASIRENTPKHPMR